MVKEILHILITFNLFLKNKLNSLIKFFCIIIILYIIIYIYQNTIIISDNKIDSIVLPNQSSGDNFGLLVTKKSNYFILNTEFKMYLQNFFKILNFVTTSFMAIMSVKYIEYINY